MHFRDVAGTLASLRRLYHHIVSAKTGMVDSHIDASRLSEGIQTIELLQAENHKLRETLEFYADPENYHAIGFLADSPCGEFAEDFDRGHGHPDYDRPMPGKRARKTLESL